MSSERLFLLKSRPVVCTEREEEEEEEELLQ